MYDVQIVDDGFGDNQLDYDGVVGNVGMEWSDDGEESGQDDSSSDQQMRDGNGEGEVGGGDYLSDRQANDGCGDGDDGDDDSDGSNGQDDDEYEEEGSYSSSGWLGSSSCEESMDADPLLSHAREIYSPDSFRVFEHEYLKSKALYADVVSEDKVFKYSSSKRGYLSRNYKVSADFLNEKVKCSCNFFVITGILCSHSLNVLRLLQITRIPEHYLLKWRLKTAVGSYMYGHTIQKRRRSGPSLDDCLSGEIGKSTIKPPYKDDDEYGTDADYIGAPLLRHAKLVYASKVYVSFGDEYKKSEYLTTQLDHESVDHRGVVADYLAFEPEHFDRRCKLHAETNEGTVRCCCRKFEQSGILCSHALSVLDALCIVRIPRQYIVAKFLKDPNSINTDETIHGPRFRELQQFACFKVFQSNCQRLEYLASQCEGLVNDALFPFETMIKVFEDKYKEETQESTAAVKQEKELKAQATFYDDQVIKNFSYKKSVSTKAPLLHCYESGFSSDD